MRAPHRTKALGDVGCALTEIKRGIELSPRDPSLPCELVRMLALAGKKDEAEIKSEIALADFGLFMTVEDAVVTVPTSTIYSPFTVVTTVP